MEKRRPKFLVKRGETVGYCYAPKGIRGTVFYGETDPRGVFHPEGKASLRSPREGDSSKGLRMYIIRTGKEER